MPWWKYRNPNRDPPGQDHWSHTFVPITLGLICLAVVIWLYLDLIHADW